MAGSMLALLAICARAQNPGVVQPVKLAELSGVYESDQGIRDRESAPVFRLRLNPNGTYEVRCNIPYRVPDMDGVRIHTYPGVERGTWRWDAQSLEVTFTASASKHMVARFPRRLHATQADFEVLKEPEPSASATRVTPAQFEPPRVPYSFHKSHNAETVKMQKEDR